MTDEDAETIRRLTLDLYRQVHQLRAGSEALLRVVIESFPEDQRRAALDRFLEYQKKIGEEMLLKLEKSSPNFAAELDKHRPLLPPDP